MTKPSELYACLYVREFPAQALLRLRPELQDRPCVVMEGAPPLQRVFSLIRKARVLGLTHGMTRVEVDIFPDVTVLLRSSKEEAAVKAVLLECVSAFSPRVECLDKDGAFLCVADIAGTRNLFGTPESLAENLLVRVQSLGIAASIVVSRSFYVAVYVAKTLSLRTARVIPAGEESVALAPLPLAVLDLTEEQAETFSLWGIRTLGMLAALPENELTARMGQAGRRLRQLAKGERRHLFQPVEPTFILEEHMELDSPVELLDSLLFIVGVMLDQLILRAKARVFSMASVRISLSLDGGATHTRIVRPALPTNDKQLWIKLLHLDLAAHPPQAAILALSLTAEPGIANKVQFGLFSPQLPEPTRLDVTLARIQAIVGNGNVGRVTLQDTHEPGKFRVEMFTVPPDSRSMVSSRPSRSAMRRVRPAEKISVTLQCQRPKAFVFRERYYVVEHSYGPWLISGDWWQPTLWGHEQGQEQWDLVARAQDSTLLYCCLVCNKAEDSWQMAALYD